MQKFLSGLILILGLCVSSFCYATLHLELTRGLDSGLPIAIVPFGGQIGTQTNNTAAKDLTDIINADLQNSGRFNLLASSNMLQFPHEFSQINSVYWKKTKVNNVLVGNVKLMTDGRYEVSFALSNLYVDKKKASEPVIIKTVIISNNELRALGHKIADMVYEKLLGLRSIFSTKIVYVLEQKISGDKGKNSYELQIADYDGNNPQTILKSNQPIISPAWAPDGKSIAYVSFEEGPPIIFIHTIATGKREKIASYTGMNSAPAFSPNGKKIAMVLTLAGSPNIYVKDLKTNKLEQITTGETIDTEPVWSPDGTKILFTSDRGGVGSPQIYQVNLTTNKIQRVTFIGSYNARASFTADGESLVMLHRDTTGIFSIAIQNSSTGRMQVLAQDAYIQSPSVAPNGAMIVYSWRNNNGVYLLGMVSSDGKVQLKLPPAEGNVREPAWSPFIGVA